MRSKDVNFLVVLLSGGGVGGLAYNLGVPRCMTETRSRQTKFPSIMGKIPLSYTILSESTLV